MVHTLNNIFSVAGSVQCDDMLLALRVAILVVAFFREMTSPFFFLNAVILHGLDQLSYVSKDIDICKQF
jgi:hypothetical protein